MKKKYNQFLFAKIGSKSSTIQEIANILQMNDTDLKQIISNLTKKFHAIHK